MGTLSDSLRQLPVVEVHADVAVRKGTGEKGPWERREQLAYLVQIDEHGVETRERTRLPLERDEAPRMPGRYWLAGGAVRLGQYGDLMLSRFEVPLVRISDELGKLIEADSRRVAA